MRTQWQYRITKRNLAHTSFGKYIISMLGCQKEKEKQRRQRRGKEESQEGKKEGQEGKEVG